MQRIGDIVTRYTDIPRPLRLARVLDNSAWSATGQSFIMVLADDVARRAIYRDGPKPEVNSQVQVMETSREKNGPMLALPLVSTRPPPCSVFYYFLINGSVYEPLGQLPQDGSMGGAIVRGVFQLGAECRGIYVSFRSYTIDEAHNITGLYDEDVRGPFDGPYTGYVQVDVVPFGVAYGYYIVFIIADSYGPIGGTS